MKNFKLILTLLLALVCVIALASCGGDEGEGTVSGETLTLNVYNWGAYYTNIITVFRLLIKDGYPMFVTVLRLHNL